MSSARHLSLAHLANDHNQLLEDDSYTYAYDGKGNRVSRTAKSGGVVETYTYDSQNRLVGYTNPTTTATYAYDAMDRRVAKTVDGSTEAWVYDPWALDTTSNDAVPDFQNGTLTRRWLHGPATDEPLAYETYAVAATPGTGTARDLHADRLGSILRVVDPATGQVAAEYTYDSFGNRTQTGSLTQRYGFTGREVDDESGLLYFRARHYDPTLGQFIQRDPIGFAGGDLNLYAYVWNDPLNFTDPSGLNAGLANLQQTSATDALALTAAGAVGFGIGALAGKTILAIINQSTYGDDDSSKDNPQEGTDRSTGSGGDPEGPNQGDKVREIIKKLNKKCFENFACKMFAKALLKELAREGIDANEVEISSETGFLTDSTGQVISTNGDHVGVQVGGDVYDNLRPNGTPWSKWLEEYGYGYPLGPKIK